MDFFEAMEMLRILSGILSKKTEERPKLVVYDAQKEGYTLWVRQNVVEPNYLSLLKEIIETRCLTIGKYGKYFVIRSAAF